MTSINITLEAYNVLLGIIFFISISVRHHLTDKVQGWFKWLSLINCLLAVSDIFRVLSEGSTTPANRIIYPIAIFCTWAFSFGIIVASVVEIMIFLHQKKANRLVVYTIIISSAIFYIFLFLTPFFNLLYSISEDNHLVHDSPFNPLPYIIQVIIYITVTIYIVINRKNINGAGVFTIIMFLVFPQTAQIIQEAIHGIHLVPTGYTITFFIMFILANRKLEGYLDDTEVELDEKSMELDQKVSEIQRSKLEVIKMQNHTIESLSNLVENRDEDTGEHVRRTRAYVELLAVQLMKNGHYDDVLNPRYIRFLKRAAPMHDIGKIVVPDAILKKPGRLTDEEFALMKLHASEGGRIVHEILDGYEDPEYIQITADIAKHHHEKWNGSGYPDGLKGDEIPLCSRIMAIADVFDALVSPRIYKLPMSYEEAFEIIREGIGEHFDPIVAQEFLNIRGKAAAVNESMKTEQAAT